MTCSLKPTAGRGKMPVTVTGTLTAGVHLPKGFDAVIAGTAGQTPFLEQTYSLLAKLVYNQTYTSKEER